MFKRYKFTLEDYKQMLKTKVIADNILNLTDARYFAAFGVDYLVFNLEHINPGAIREIKEWVEGVKILIDADGQITPALLDFIISVSPEGVVSATEELLKDLLEQFPEQEFFLRQEDEKLIDYKNQDQLPFIKIASSTQSIETLLATETISGVIVEGEPEEKVGFKNFDQLDEIFELLAI